MPVVASGSAPGSEPADGLARGSVPAAASDRPWVVSQADLSSGPTSPSGDALSTPPGEVCSDLYEETVSELQAEALKGPAAAASSSAGGCPGDELSGYGVKLRLVPGFMVFETLDEVSTSTHQA